MGININGSSILGTDGNKLDFYTNSGNTHSARLDNSGIFHKYYTPAIQGTWQTGYSTRSGRYPISGLTVNSDGMGGQATNNWRFTAPISGAYYCWFASITGNNQNWYGAIYKNGGDYGINYPNRASIGRASASWDTSNTAIIDYLNAGDVWEFYINAGTYFHGSYHSGLLAFYLG